MVMPSSSNGNTSNAGITQLSDGKSVIPSSTRADGSVRKEIRVKPGYKPPEDIAVYKNRTAEAWKNRGKSGVPGAEPLTESGSLSQSAAAQKNAKRREARKKAAAAAEDQLGIEKPAVINGATVETASPEAKELDQEKEARKLAKKLRQARELQDKKEQGDSLLPEQLAKVIKIHELIRQLDSLGFDAEGEAKPTINDPDSNG